MRYNGVYESMTFPPYVFHEYPKWIKLKDGTQMIVNTQSEELRAMSNDLTEEPKTFDQVANDALEAKDAEIAELRAQLRAIAVKREARPDPKVVPSGTVVPKAST